MELILLLILLGLAGIGRKPAPGLKGPLPPDVSAMTPRQYEFYCAQWLQGKGYLTEVTQQSGDHNIDILVKNADGKIIGIAECKKWKGKVGARYLKILHASMIEQGVTQGWFFSTGGYSTEAVRYALRLPKGYFMSLE